MWPIGDVWMRDWNTRTHLYVPATPDVDKYDTTLLEVATSTSSRTTLCQTPFSDIRELALK
jgi:hypothetical protein